jgi:hypothetical protein
VKKAGTSVLKATIDQMALSIDVARILPPTSGSSIGNIKVSSTTTVSTDASSDPNAPLLASIAAEIKGSTPGVTDEQAMQMAGSFLGYGYTDLNFIKAISPIISSLPNTFDMIASLRQAGITDLNQAVFLSNVGVADPLWMKTVLDSGVTNVFLAGNLQAAIGNGNSALLASVANAVSGYQDDVIKLAIADIKTTDPIVAQQIYSSVAPLVNTDGWVGWGIVEGGWYKDPAKMAAIYAATAGAPPLIGAGLAYVGVSDLALSQQIQSILSVVSDPWAARSIIMESGANPTLIQTAVNQYLAANQPAPSTTTQTTTTASTGTTTTTSTLTVETLISTCTTCNAITF